MSVSRTITVGGKDYEVIFKTIVFSTRQVSEYDNSDGSSTVHTYLDAHCSYSIPDIKGRLYEFSTVTELQEISSVEVDSEGLRTSITETPLEYSTQDEVIDAVETDVGKTITDYLVSFQEKSIVNNVNGKVSKLVLA